jgi:hypothetical protein
MTDRERWRQDLEEIELFIVLFFTEAWIAFWWLVHHSYITL